MLRVSASRVLLHRGAAVPPAYRTFATAAQKRALSKTQVEGATESSGSSTVVKPPSLGGPPIIPPVKKEDDPKVRYIAAGAALMLFGGAMAYRPDLLSDVLPFLDNTNKEKEKAAVAVVKTEDKVKKEDKSAVVVKKEKEKEDKSVVMKKVKKEEKVVKVKPEKEKEKATKMKKKSAAVLEKKEQPKTASSSTVTSKAKAVSKKVATPSVAAAASMVTPHRVTVEAMSAVGFPPRVVARPVVPPPTVPQVEHPHKVTMAPTSPQNQAWSTESAVEAAKELRSNSAHDTNATINAALSLLRKDMDEAWLSDLDTLSPSDLKIRLIRLATDMGDKARFEALRMKEMLSLKEKEIADQYLLILQQQRLQFEELLSHRLREQEETLTRQSSTTLQQREDSIQAVLQAAASAQAEEHKAELESTTKLLRDSVTAHYEADYATQLAAAKAHYTDELAKMHAVLAGYDATVRSLQTTAQASKTFETNSQRAHLISAAASALAQRLETSKPFERELTTLEAVSRDDAVLAAALATMRTGTTGGVVPTLPQLQQRFERVFRSGRRAALVPEGTVSLGAQLVGLVFSGLRGVPPEGDDVVGAAGDESVLTRAKHDVDVGDLDGALRQLQSLQGGGQVAFTVQDWVRDAKERVTVNRCLRVVKTECALLNESMAGQ